MDGKAGKAAAMGSAARIGWLQQITGGFMSRVVSGSRHGGPSLEELLIVDEGVLVDCCYAAFEANWRSELQGTGGKQRRGPSLARALWRTFWRELLVAALLKLGWGFFMLFSIAFFVRELLQAIKVDAGQSGVGSLLGQGLELNAKNIGYVLCACFFVGTVLQSVCIQQMSAVSARLGIRVKAVTASAVYRKAMSYDRYQNHMDVVSLVATDCSKLADACTSLQYLWSSTIEALGIVGVLLGLAGEAALPGFGVMLVVLPLQYFIGVKIAHMRKRVAAAADARVMLMDEILQAIKLVKMYTWERKFADSVGELRAKEMHLSLIGSVLKSVNMTFIFVMPPLMGLSIFGVYQLDNELEATMAFTTLLLFNAMRLPLLQLPKGLRAAGEAMTALDRVSRFLLSPDREVKQKAQKTEISFSQAFLTYGSSTEPLLKDITVNISKGCLAMVAGPVGCGKSNLLQAIMGQMKTLSGAASIGGSFAYVPQNPWCAHGTIRDNILFGRPLDEPFYKQVLFACALEADLALMEEGDATQIGERGMNLSGGQKQRIALARAAYSGADTLLLDAPLSAVDMYTCQHIFKHCIQGIFVGKGATVVLVTHQVELFSHADLLLFMLQGEVRYAGPYDTRIVKEFFPNASIITPAAGAASSADDPKAANPAAPQLPTSAAGVAAAEASHVARPAAPAAPASRPPAEQPVNGLLVLFWQMRWYLFLISLVFYVAAQMARIYGDIWVARWVAKTGSRTNDFYVGVFGGYVSVFFVLLFFRGGFFYWIGLRAVTELHATMFSSILKAPMAFFTKTPLGHVLSTFSSDMDTVDEALLDEIHMVFIYLVILGATIGVVIRVVPVFAAVAAGLALSFFFYFSLYLRASASLKLQVGKFSAAVAASVSETLQGLDVIQAYRMESRFLSRNVALMDSCSTASFNMEMLQLWLAFRLDLICCVLVLAACLLSLGLPGIPAAAAGLAISNGYQVLLFFSQMVTRASNINANTACVGRVVKLGRVEPERDLPLRHDTCPPAVWPSSGELGFHGVVMAYAPGLPNVLKGVDFTIRPSEKIGVVGRTGAGKSSLIMAIFRLAELSEGAVRVDGLDIAKFNLGELRRRFAIIPQEPVMFRGTLRSNLDPFHERPDEELRAALRACLVGDMVDSAEGLQTAVAHMGGNFSLGQRQLICLARALLNPSRLLLLDEATAALDSDTDAAVQRVLRANFADRTMVTIAHRLETIIDSDRILVMDAGRVAEFDSPYALLSRASIFTQLCRQTGNQYEALREAAERHQKAVLAPTATVVSQGVL
jgi:ATP-binding cassette, subfamily C (CFTR/MRP), member 1